VVHTPHTIPDLLPRFCNDYFIQNNEFIAFDVITAVHGDTKETAVSTGTCISLALSLACSSCVLPGEITGGVPDLFAALKTVPDLYYFAVLVLSIVVQVLLWKGGRIHAKLKARRDHSMMSQASIYRVGQLRSVNIMVSFTTTHCVQHPWTDRDCAHDAAIIRVHVQNHLQMLRNRE